MADPVAVLDRFTVRDKRFTAPLASGGGDGGGGGGGENFVLHEVTIGEAEKTVNKISKFILRVEGNMGNSSGKWGKNFLEANNWRSEKIGFLKPVTS